jgi:UDP-N-acetylmuramoyl-L-alanyl-D-glutamate--2,6-diaminopimelate ligase
VYSKPLSQFWTDAVAKAAGFIESRGEGDPVVTNLVYDSRRVEAGSLYFALPGAHVDGHDYIAEAVKRGASVVIHSRPFDAAWLSSRLTPACCFIRVENTRFAMSPIAAAFFERPGEKLTVVGVTGTEGKSTTVSLIWQLLRALGKKAGFVSTVQYSLGDDALPNPAHETTPEAPVVQERLAAMLAAGCEYAVLEASSHGLSRRTNRLGDACFDAGVMTNVTSEHLEFHGTWEQYRDDKANLFRAVRQFGVVNEDDQSASYFQGVTDAPVYGFSTRGKPGELSVSRIESRADGNAYTVTDATGEAYSVSDRLPGAFNCGNVLAASIVVSKLLKQPYGAIFAKVPSLTPVLGRMTRIDKGQPFEVIVDYAHTPSSFEAIFPSLQARAHAKGALLIALFGSGGERDTQKRPKQGAVAAKYCDCVVLADEDPRGEVPLSILEDIAAGIPPDFPNLFLIPDRFSAIKKAFAIARPGDIVLLLGKGHENSIIYADRTIPWNEIEAAEQALAIYTS